MVEQDDNLKLANELKRQTVKELKIQCRAKSLHVSGNKDDLVKRLMGEGPVAKKPKHDGGEAGEKPRIDQIAEWTLMSAPELKEEVRRRGMKTSGTIPELLSRLVTGKTHPKDEAIEIAQRLGANPYLRDKFNEHWQQEEGFAKNAVYRVYKLLVHYPIKITSGKQAMKLKGIGKGSAKHIDQWLAEEGKTMEEEEDEKGSDAEFAPAKSRLRLSLEGLMGEGYEQPAAGWTAQQLHAQATEEGLFEDEVAMDEVREQVQEMAADGTVYTTADAEHFLMT